MILPFRIQSSNAVDTICITIEDYCRDFVHLKDRYYESLLQKAQNKVWVEYMKALLSRWVLRDGREVKAMIYRFTIWDSVHHTGMKIRFLHLGASRAPSHSNLGLFSPPYTVWGAYWKGNSVIQIIVTWYVTYLSLHYYIIKLVLFQIMLNIFTYLLC